MNSQLIKRTAVILVALGLLTWLIVAVIAKQPFSKDGNINVVTTFYPLQEYAQAVGGEKVSVSRLVKAGLEPHDFEPSPQDIASIKNADLFIYNGAGLEPWVDKILKEIEQDSVKVLNASEGIELVKKSPH